MVKNLIDHVKNVANVNKYTRQMNIIFLSLKLVSTKKFWKVESAATLNYTCNAMTLFFINFWVDLNLTIIFKFTNLLQK